MARLADDFDARIKDLRVFLGETQDVFADRWGRRSRQIGAWENGRQVPPYRSVAKVARENGWPVAIFEEGGPMPSDALKGAANERTPPGASSGPAAPSEAVARYYADVRAMLLRRAGGTVNADVMLDAWEGLWRRLTATPASGDPVDGEDAADVRRAAALRQAEAQHRLQRGG